MPDLERAAVELLGELIRHDTVNPPGRERVVQELLRDRLAAAGFECELLALEEERPNLVARLRGKGPGPTLGYISHTDTVLANPSEWTHDPWSGDVDDGFVWGRGALDMKDQTAAEVTAAIALAETGWRPANGDLLVMCVADEEAGGALGAQFLCEQHPDAVRCDMLINEGGGNFFDYDGRRFYGVGCAEKGVFRFTLSTDGVAGHASIPKMGDNALLRMGPLLQRFAERQPGYDLTDEPRALLSALSSGNGGGELDPASAIAEMQATDPLLAMLVEPTMGVTLVPTRIRASEKVNVIPSQAHLQVDCRVPPGLGEREARARIEEVLGPDGYRIEFSESIVGNRSAMESPLMDEIRRWLEEQEPDAEVVPTVLPGFTDSRWFRGAFPDCVAYGFFPHRHMTMLETAPLIHGADERIDVRDLAFATSFFYELAPRVLG